MGQWFLIATLVFGNPASGNQIMNYELPRPFPSLPACALTGGVAIAADATVQKWLDRGWRVDGWTCTDRQAI